MYWFALKSVVVVVVRNRDKLLLAKQEERGRKNDQQRPSLPMNDSFLERQLYLRRVQVNDDWLTKQGGPGWPIQSWPGPMQMICRLLKVVEGC